MAVLDRLRAARKNGVYTNVEANPTLVVGSQRAVRRVLQRLERINGSNFTNVRDLFRSPHKKEVVFGQKVRPHDLTPLTLQQVDRSTWALDARSFDVGNLLLNLGLKQTVSSIEVNLNRLPGVSSRIAYRAPSQFSGMAEATWTTQTYLGPLGKSLHRALGRLVSMEDLIAQIGKQLVVSGEVTPLNLNFNTQLQARLRFTHPTGGVFQKAANYADSKLTTTMNFEADDYTIYCGSDGKAQVDQNQGVNNIAIEEKYYQHGATLVFRPRFSAEERPEDFRNVWIPGDRALKQIKKLVGLLGA